MPTSKDFETLGYIYEAATNLGRWRRALDGTAEAIGAKAIALLIRGSDPTDRDKQMLSSAYLNFTRSPWGIYYGLRLSRLQDPDWDYLSRQPAHKPTLDTEIGPSAAALDNRRDYALLRRKVGVGRRMGIRLSRDQVWFDATSIAFDAQTQKIPPSALESARHLLPHLTKSVELGRIFGQLKARYRATLAALDNVQVGLAIALPSGEIIVENADAQISFATKDAIWKSPQGRLTTSSADHTAEIQAAIDTACQTAAGQDIVAEHLIAVPKLCGNTSLLLDIAPLRDSKAELEPELSGALITLIDPDRLPKIKTRRFSELYGLTEAEADVLTLLLEGQQLPEIAERRNTSPVTVKNQIAAILAKTGTKSRSDLIRLVLRVLPPVR